MLDLNIYSVHGMRYIGLLITFNLVSPKDPGVFQRNMFCCVKQNQNFCPSMFSILPRVQELSLQIVACQGSAQASLWSLAQSPGLVKYAVYWQLSNERVKVIVEFLGRKWKVKVWITKKALESLVIASDYWVHLRKKWKRKKNYTKLHPKYA